MSEVPREREVKSLNDDLYVVVRWKPVVSVSLYMFLFCVCVRVCVAHAGMHPPITVSIVWDCQATMNTTAVSIAGWEEEAYDLRMTLYVHLWLNDPGYILKGYSMKERWQKIQIP